MNQLQTRPNPDECVHNWGLILGFTIGTGAPETALCCMICDTFDGEVWDGGIVKTIQDLDIGNGVIVNGLRHNALRLIIVPVNIYVRRTVVYDAHRGMNQPEQAVQITVRPWWTPPPELQAAQIIDVAAFHETLGGAQ